MLPSREESGIERGDVERGVEKRVGDSPGVLERRHRDQMAQQPLRQRLCTVG